MLSKECYSSLAKSLQGANDSAQVATTIETGYWKFGKHHQRATSNRKEMKSSFLSSC